MSCSLDVNKPEELLEAKDAFIKLMDEVFSDKYFGVPEDPEVRRKKFLTSDISFLPRTMIKNIYEAAEQILASTQQGDVLVAFGNTPFLIYKALSHLVAKDSADQNYRQLVVLPFSGSPNRVREGSFPTPKDTVTPERLQHLRRIMTMQGLTPDNPNAVNHTTYFIDVIGSGAGPAYVMNQMIATFAERKLLPKMATISLNQINVENNADRRNSFIAKKSATDGQKTRFYFPNWQTPSFAVDNFVIYLGNHARLDMLPSGFRFLPEYNSMFWTTYYDWVLLTPPTDFVRVLLEYFDTNVEEYLKTR